MHYPFPFICLSYVKYETSKSFLEHISNSFINNAVLLSDGQEAEVVMINRQFLSRPIVKTKDSFIDLSKNTNIFIQAII